MTDREKKIAMIRETLQYRHTSSLYDAEYKANVDEWIRFLLSELEQYEGMYRRAEDQLRAEIKTSAYLQKELERMEEEITKLQEECDKWKASRESWRQQALWANGQVRSMQQVKEKLIEGLKEIANEKLLIGSTAIQMKSKARYILKEVGVSVDEPS